MDGETAIITKPDGSVEKLPESTVKMFGASVSTRSIITFIVILTVCYMSATQVKIEEPLYTLAGLIVGFYFGQNGKPKSQV